jgi:hypothetical protein
VSRWAGVAHADAIAHVRREPATWLWEWRAVWFMSWADGGAQKTRKRRAFESRQ